ncbi:roadblock/LC7 domain-containing protein [Calditerrivibrio nitroreducens]|uniref:Roadblock/LC7 family protein n=1 Tax=Calditerrivibrio nitroreducens (strain DSM 19672 / NBRC 101217 / Yu37-1) TaxID=768670 RepID=E4TJT7_CALNY|nr:roadblock/LC7 domain-containing protein [Calditerrivibrio nitroreducens]ADR19283.1 Roadblock/LC7 family protein [Calditerrivibrio nitroreducens DSM 19672]
MQDYLWLNDVEIIKKLQNQIEQLKLEANSKATFLIDKSGQMVASSGDSDEFDATSLAALVAGNVAATDGIAKLLGEKEFSVLFHEGENEHLNITLVDGKLILVVLFDDSTSLGLVRLKMKKYVKIIADILNDSKPNNSIQQDIFSDITDEDIEKMFRKGS